MTLGRISISPGFLLLISWLNYIDRQGVLWWGLLSCAAHEAGHLLILRHLKKHVKVIYITIFGATIVIDDNLSYGQELVSAIAGPAVNLVLATVMCRIPGGEWIAGLNFALGCFNLLPFGQLDGGRFLSCLVNLFTKSGAGERVVCAVSWLVGSMAAGVGIILWRAGGNLTLLLMAAWICCAMGKR